VQPFAHGGGDIGQLQQSRSTLRGLLRDYRDKAGHYIKNLRDDLASTAKALQQLTETLQQSDSDHESRLRTSIAQLREVSRTPRCGEAGPIVLAAAGSIEDSVQSLRNQHELTIAQFQIEIRMLHKRIDDLERASMLENLNTLLTPADIEDHIREAGERAFSLTLLKVNGFEMAERLFSPAVALEMAGAFHKRLRNGLPPDAAIARWRSSAFVIMMNLSKAESIGRAKWIADNLSGVYSCLKDGKTVRPSLTVAVAVVDRSPGEPASKVLTRVAEFLGE
jgi:GGDEF domain-containing protein